MQIYWISNYYPMNMAAYIKDEGKQLQFTYVVKKKGLLIA